MPCSKLDSQFFFFSIGFFYTQTGFYHNLLFLHFSGAKIAQKKPMLTVLQNSMICLSFRKLERRVIAIMTRYFLFVRLHQNNSQSILERRLLCSSLIDELLSHSLASLLSLLNCPLFQQLYNLLGSELNAISTVV